jgi:GTP-binding nuclear protein Ran
MQTFKVVLVGDGNVGKSAFVERPKTGSFLVKYVPTQGVNVTNLAFNTNYGIICFNVWDCAGREEYKGLGAGYYYGASAAIVMFDVTDKSSFEKAKKLVIPFDHLPLVLLGNKSDLKDRKITLNDVGAGIDLDIDSYKYFDYSVKSNYNFEKPWLELTQKLLKKKDLIFTDIKDYEPPKVVTDVNEMNKEVNKEINDIIRKEVIKVTPHSSVSWIDIPGGRMKVTYEFFSNEK